MSIVIIQHPHGTIRTAPENVQAPFTGTVSPAMAAHLKKIDISFVRISNTRQGVAIEFYRGTQADEIRSAIKSIFNPIYFNK